MKIIKTEGLVLKKTDYSEADRILTVFTRECGKKIITAKGIRKSNRRDKYGTDILVISDFILYDRDENAVLSAIELKEPFIELKKDIKKINIAIYLLIVLDGLIMENLPKKEFYDFTAKTIRYISKNNSSVLNMLSVVNFLFRIINDEGIMFKINKGAYLNVENGKVEDEKKGKYIKISEYQKEVLIKLEQMDSSILKNNALDYREIIELIVILEAYIEYNLNIKIKIKDFVKEGL